MKLSVGYLERSEYSLLTLDLPSTTLLMTIEFTVTERPLKEVRNVSLNPQLS